MFKMYKVEGGGITKRERSDPKWQSPEDWYGHVN